MNQMTNPPGMSPLAHGPASQGRGPGYGQGSYGPGYGGNYGYGYGYGHGHPEDEATPEFVEYWRAIMLRKWWILGTMLVFGAIAAYVVSQMTPTYRSTATVLIESTKSKIVGVDEVYSGVSNNREYFQTQAEGMKSRDIAERVVRELGLAKVPEFDPNNTSKGLRGWLVEAMPFAADWLPTPELLTSEAEIEANVVEQFSKRLTIEPIRLSQLVKVSFDSQDPQLAAQAANAVAEAFIVSDMEQRSQITQRAGEAINQRLGELKANLDASQRALQAYREKEGLIDSKSMIQGGQGRQLDDLTQRLVEARVKRADAEETYNLIRAGGASLDSVPAVVRNPGVQRAREIEAEAIRAVNEVAERYGPDHPRHVSAAAELASAKANVKRQIDVVLASATKEYNMARATEKAIEDEMRQSKGQLQNVNRKELQASGLEREVESNRQIYQTFLARFKETQATNDMQAASARVTDQAIPATLPIRPAKAASVALASLVGVMLAIVGAVIIKRMNNRVETSSDVERKLLQPYLAGLPVQKVRSDAGLMARAVVDAPGELYAESIRTAATGVMLSGMGDAHKVIAVTSSLPGEGKSTFSSNLAFWLCRTKKVLLIEADMRKPSLTKALKLSGKHKGLAEFITGEATLEDAVIVAENSDLHLMLCGSPPPNPLELLVSDRFKEVLEQIRAVYDVIVIDTPPVQLMSDAIVIGTHITGLVYVVKADSTPVAMARGGLRRLMDAGVPIIGVVLNQQDYKRAQYYGETGAYGKKYGYGKYGYGEKAGAAS
ncbi:MAG: polysaccharide biosynthesis tyrosine autokinase [Burkholderiaceae bacterium]